MSLNHLYIPLSRHNDAYIVTLSRETISSGKQHYTIQTTPSLLRWETISGPGRDLVRQSASWSWLGTQTTENALASILSLTEW
jgi:hypothetical protein